MHLSFRNIALLFIVSFAFPVFAQTSLDTYWVPFSDKNNTPYSLSAPEQYLSARSMARRAQQGIPYDALDLPVDPAYVQAVLATGDVTLVNRSKWFNGVTIRTTDMAALAAIQDLSFVQGMRPTGNSNTIHSTFPKFADPGMERDGEPELYGQSFRQIEMLNGHLLHAIQAQGQGMLIGVLDSGFLGVDSALAFQQLRDRNGVILTRDMVVNDGDVYDDHNHGRSVLSCMAGDLTGQLLGTAPEANYVLLRTEDADSEYPVEEDNWVAGAELADSIGCDVLNTSLGYTVFDDSTMDHTYSQLDGQTLRISIAANIALRKGMIPVNSAGNSGSSEWYYIGAPADAIGILSVGSVDEFENSSSFSSRGPSADGRVKPEVCAMGAGSIVLRSEVDSVVAANGTSFASPILAGLVACLWQLHPERTAPQIIDAVKRSGSIYNTPNDSLGYGIPDFAAAHAWLGATAGISDGPGEHIALFPIPFSDVLIIGLPFIASGSVDVALYDLTGRQVWKTSTQAGGDRVILRDDRLAVIGDGAYVMRLQVDGRTMTRTVIKAR